MKQTPKHQNLINASFTERGKELDYTFLEGASGLFDEETPGKWKDTSSVLKDYRRISVRYRLSCDYSYLLRTNRGRRFI